MNVPVLSTLKLRGRLTLYVTLVAVVPLLTVNWLGLTSTARLLREQVRELLQVEAQELKDLVEQSLVEREAGVRAWAEDALVREALETGASWKAEPVLARLQLRYTTYAGLVLFTNEENGLRGGNAYRDQHMAELPDHVLLLESDGGVFDPAGFGFTGSDEGRATVTAIASLLSSIGADRIAPSGGGADIGPSGQAAGIPMMSHLVNGDYFLIHHTPTSLTWPTTSFS